MREIEGVKIKCVQRGRLSALQHWGLSDRTDRCWHFPPDSEQETRIVWTGSSRFYTSVSLKQDPAVIKHQPDLTFSYLCSENRLFPPQNASAGKTVWIILAVR